MNLHLRIRVETRQANLRETQKGNPERTAESGSQRKGKRGADMTNGIMLAFLGWPEIVAILAVVLLLFGAKKLPELARGLGRGIQEFKKATQDVQNELERAIEEPPPPPRPVSPPPPSPPPGPAATTSQPTQPHNPPTA